MTCNVDDFHDASVTNEDLKDNGREHFRRVRNGFRKAEFVFIAVTLFLITASVTSAAEEAKAATTPTAAVSAAASPAATAATTATPVVETKKKVKASSLISAPVKLVSKETAPPPALEFSNVMTKTVYGQVGLLNEIGFSLVSERDEEGGVSREIWLPFLSNVSLKGYESVDDLKPGDFVSVTYEEVTDVRRRSLKKIGLERSNVRLREKSNPEPPAEVVSVSFLREQQLEPQIQVTAERDNVPSAKKTIRTR